MKRKMSLVAVVIGLLLLMTGLTACGGNSGEDAIVGRWQLADNWTGSEWYVAHAVLAGSSLEFFSDGTLAGVITTLDAWHNRQSTGNVRSGATWRADGTRLHITGAGGFLPFDRFLDGTSTFVVSRNSLTITLDHWDDDPITFTRVR